MVDVFLRRNESQPTEVKLTDPTAPPPAGTPATVAVTGFDLSTKGRVADGGVAATAVSSVTVDVADFGLTAALGTVAVTGDALVSPAGQALTAALGTPIVSGEALVTATGLQLIAEMGTVQVITGEQQEAVGGSGGFLTGIGACG